MQFSKLIMRQLELRYFDVVFVRWKGVNGVYPVLCVDGVHGVIYIQKKPFGPMWQ